MHVADSNGDRQNPCVLVEKDAEMRPVPENLERRRDAELGKNARRPDEATTESDAFRSPIPNRRPRRAVGRSFVLG